MHLDYDITSADKFAVDVPKRREVSVLKTILIEKFDKLFCISIFKYFVYLSKYNQLVHAKTRAHNWGIVGQSLNSLTSSLTTWSSNMLKLIYFPSYPSRRNTSHTCLENPHLKNINRIFLWEMIINTERHVYFHLKITLQWSHTFRTYKQVNLLRKYRRSFHEQHDLVVVN